MEKFSHREKILRVQEQIRAAASNGGEIKIQKEAVSHFVPNPFEKRTSANIVDVRDLNEILKIDTEKKICIAEPGVTFVDLVHETLKFGLVPYTVPELKTITIGGAVSGCSVESMSYRYGGFHDSCLEYEVIKGSGEVVTCSKDSRPDMFDMMHGSYGTLGIISKIVFKLHPAKKFVKMEYVKFHNFREFWLFLREACLRGERNFIDAIIHGPEEFVVCLGSMVDMAPKASRYDWLKIFYKSTKKLKVDYLKTEDYFFRYDTECHWLTKTVPLMETLPARLVVGKFVLGSTNLIKWSKRLKPLMRLKKRPEVVVDVFIPAKKFEEFFKWYEKDFDFYPLWIVPYKIEKPYPWINGEHLEPGETLYIDCAVYGKQNNEDGMDYSKFLEKKTVELRGIKTLISRNHFSEDEFWQVYDRKNYLKIKSETDPRGVFKDLYKKFHP